ncbi:MAG: hypothetical protein Q4B68_08350 [Bacteroidales bacterium]|nr:hypothetical protein [Bacteroidales bacterium]
MAKDETSRLDDLYINDFHREWNERCMVERRRTESMHFSHEFLKAQSMRMDELVRQQEEQERLERKKAKKKGQSPASEEPSK